MSNSSRETNLDDMKKEFQSDEVFSLLYTAINSGKFWRCIRWCDEGSTVLITSPVLFEREVLRREEWKQRLNVNDFPNFADLLMQVGFQKVLNQRPSKVKKFRHPDFKKDCENLQALVKESRTPLKRKRETSEKEKLELSAANSMEEKNRERDSAQKVKRQRRVTFEDDRARTAMKRKRNGSNGEEMPLQGKKRKRAAPDTPRVPINHDTTSQQMSRIYSDKEMIAAQAFLSLSTPVVFANYTAMELMAAKSLVNLSRSCTVQQAGRSPRELEAAHALLELAYSVGSVKESEVAYALLELAN